MHAAKHVVLEWIFVATASSVELTIRLSAAARKASVEAHGALSERGSPLTALRGRCESPSLATLPKRLNRSARALLPASPGPGPSSATKPRGLLPRTMAATQLSRLPRAVGLVAGVSRIAISLYRIPLAIANCQANNL